jgi:hypothetical protein
MPDGTRKGFLKKVAQDGQPDRDPWSTALVAITLRDVSAAAKM